MEKYSVILSNNERTITVNLELSSPNKGHMIRYKDEYYEINRVTHVVTMKPSPAYEFQQYPENEEQVKDFYKALIHANYVNILQDETIRKENRPVISLHSRGYNEGSYKNMGMEFKLSEYIESLIPNKYQDILATGRIQFITESLTDQQLGNLYNSIDCGVVPSRAEVW